MYTRIVIEFIEDVVKFEGGSEYHILLYKAIHFEFGKDMLLDGGHDRIPQVVFVYGFLHHLLFTL